MKKKICSNCRFWQPQNKQCLRLQPTISLRLYERFGCALDISTDESFGCTKFELNKKCKTCKKELRAHSFISSDGSGILCPIAGPAGTQYFGIREIKKEIIHLSSITAQERITDMLVRYIEEKNKHKETPLDKYFGDNLNNIIRFVISIYPIS